MLYMNNIILNSRVKHSVDAIMLDNVGYCNGHTKYTIFCSCDAIIEWIKMHKYKYTINKCTHTSTHTDTYTPMHTHLVHRYNTIKSCTSNGYCSTLMATPQGSITTTITSSVQKRTPSCLYYFSIYVHLKTMYN